MNRRTSGAAAEQAAAAASEAARVLQARQQEAKAEKPEPKSEPEPASKAKNSDRSPFLSGDKAAELRKANPRNSALEAISRRRGEAPDEEEPTAQEAPKTEPEAAPAATPEAAAPAVEVPATTPTPEAPRTVRVKVDGEEFDASAEEVEAAGGLKPYQIQRAAENRLKKANEALAETKRIADLVLRSAPQPGPDKPKESDSEFIASKMDIIRFGSPQEAAQAQIEIQQRLSRPVDPNAIMQQTMANIRFDAAEQQFMKDNADLMQNPIIARAVAGMKHEEVRKHMQNGQPNWQAIAAVDWIGFFNRMAHDVRGAFGRPSQPASAPTAVAGTPSQPPEKEARKASIVNLPTAAARAGGVKEEESLSPEEERKRAIEEMKRRRGQRY